MKSNDFSSLSDNGTLFLARRFSQNGEVWTMYTMSKPPMVPPKVRNVLANFEKTILENRRFSVTSGMYLSAKLSQTNTVKQQTSAGINPNGGKRGKPSISLKEVVHKIPDHLDESCVDFTVTIDDTENRSAFSDDDDISVMSYMSLHSGSRRSSIGGGSRRGSIVSLPSNHAGMLDENYDDRSTRSNTSVISKTSARIRELPRDLELSSHDSSYSSSSDDSIDEQPFRSSIAASGKAPRHW